MHVIFLDVDGVLNSEAFMLKLDEQHRQLGHDEPSRPKGATTCGCYRLPCQIDRAAVSRLNRLVAETSAKIVVSSTWRKLFEPPELRQVLASHGLVAEIIGETTDGHHDPEMVATFGHVEQLYRGYEIDLWLRKHPEVDRFVILDDGSDMVMHKNRLVQTSWQSGLLDDHVDLAIRVMAWDGETTPSPMDEMESNTMSKREEVAERPGSSWGLHCHHEGCIEALTLSRTTTEPPTHDDDYQNLCPALDTAAVLLGWRTYRHVWWCPMHVVAKNIEGLEG